ncbi:MAG TPA: Asp23/Gls24 family envelope stress response protein [Gaiellaceae bacterium]|nr:Asp23/Gls24 family envelope stress response protein [Gaiellaceae bacterium]
MTDDGVVTVTDAALQQIVHQAAESVDGARVRRRHTQIAIETGGARVSLELTAPLGVVLPALARAVQEHVAHALGTMSGVNVAAVDVTVEELD